MDKDVVVWGVYEWSNSREDFKLSGVFMKYEDALKYAEERKATGVRIAVPVKDRLDDLIEKELIARLGDLAKVLGPELKKIKR